MGPQVKKLTTIPDLIKHTGIQQQLPHSRWAIGTGTRVFWCITADNCEKRSEIHSTPLPMPRACCKAKTLSTLLSKVSRQHQQQPWSHFQHTATSLHSQCHHPALSSVLPARFCLKLQVPRTSPGLHLQMQRGWSFWAGWCLPAWCQLLLVPNGTRGILTLLGQTPTFQLVSKGSWQAEKEMSLLPTTQQSNTFGFQL